MRQDYFIHNGKQYNTGTIIIMLWFCCASRSLSKTKAKFLYYDTETKKYAVEIYGKKEVYTNDRFYKMFIEVYDPKSQHISDGNRQNKAHTFSDELDIDSLLVAWVWYIFIMAVSFIFYDRVGIWIMSSIIFFRYRNKKLKEAGYK